MVTASTSFLLTCYQSSWHGLIAPNPPTPKKDYSVDREMDIKLNLLTSYLHAFIMTEQYIQEENDWIFTAIWYKLCTGLSLTREAFSTKEFLWILRASFNICVNVYVIHSAWACVKSREKANNSIQRCFILNSYTDMHEAYAILLSRPMWEVSISLWSYHLFVI